MYLGKCVLNMSIVMLQTIDFLYAKFDSFEHCVLKFNVVVVLSLEILFINDDDDNYNDNEG